MFQNARDEVLVLISFETPRMCALSSYKFIYRRIGGGAWMSQRLNERTDQYMVALSSYRVNMSC